MEWNGMEWNGRDWVRLLAKNEKNSLDLAIPRTSSPPRLLLIPMIPFSRLTPPYPREKKKRNPKKYK